MKYDNLYTKSYNDFLFLEEKVKHYIKSEEESDILYNVLSSNKYSRSEPVNVLDIKQNFFNARLLDTPIRLFGLWGGSKESQTRRADKADIETLDHLANINSKLNKMKPPYHLLDIYLLFCDVHHIVCNGKDPDLTLDYYQSLEPLAKERNLNLLKLSEILNLRNLSDFVKLDQYLNEPYSRKEAIKLFKNEGFVQEVIESMKKHSDFARRMDKSRHDKLAKLYVEMEIYFLRYTSSEHYPKMFATENSRGGLVYFSLSNPEIQKSIAEAANVPMLFFWSREGHHGEVPWYREAK